MCVGTIIQAGIHNVIMRQGDGADNYISITAATAAFSSRQPLFPEK